MNIRETIALVFLLASIVVAGCARQGHWNAKNISGLMPDLKFNLTDETGKSVTAANYRGKTLMLFFGYTNCPDFCPTTLAKLAQVLDQIPNERKEVRVLFVSVDPKRDSPKNLAIYTNNFAPEVIGLTGSEPMLRELTKRYRTTFSYGKPNALGNYEVSHGLAVYVFDKTGKARLMILDKQTVPQIVTDLKRLIGESA
ncbi:MAG TPA: SCO family protein [Pseudomonadales bacterium]|nr:SCO family protein [Pseudomonadales bacterium]